MIRFVVAGVHSHGQELKTDLDLLAHVEGKFKITVDDKTLYEEVEFPVVELAAALSRWISGPLEARADFEFDSMSAEELGLVWIRRSGDGWRIGSINQEFPAIQEWTSEEVESTIRKFKHDLMEAARVSFGMETEALLVKVLNSSESNGH